MSLVFDYNGSLHRMGDDPELFQEMVGLLMADAPSLLVALTHLLDRGDFSSAQRTAHTLKGLAANFGAERVVAAAAEVERLASQRQPAGMEVACETLRRAVDELIGALGDQSPCGGPPLTR